MDCKTREEVELNLKHPGRYMFDAAQVLHKIGYFKSAYDELTGALWRTGAFFCVFQANEARTWRRAFPLRACCALLARFALAFARLKIAES